MTAKAATTAKQLTIVSAPSPTTRRRCTLLAERRLPGSSQLDFRTGSSTNR
ncbi:hypothetical protein [Leifsonia xyli]|uniref:hypothetical protein n=1 Tax=Leifsonia xyli TaxID=1575 RepID=UPI00210CF19D|nr:hypothetical protein [Leifsonia xyli]